MRLRGTEERRPRGEERRPVKQLKAEEIPIRVRSHPIDGYIYIYIFLLLATMSRDDLIIHYRETNATRGFSRFDAI